MSLLFVTADDDEFAPEPLPIPQIAKAADDDEEEFTPEPVAAPKLTDDQLKAAKKEKAELMNQKSSIDVQIAKLEKNIEAAKVEEQQAKAPEPVKTDQQSKPKERKPEKPITYAMVHDVKGKREAAEAERRAAHEREENAKKAREKLNKKFAKRKSE